MPVGNESAHVLHGLTVDGGLALRNVGSGAVAYLSADESGGIIGGTEPTYTIRRVSDGYFALSSSGVPLIKTLDWGAAAQAAITSCQADGGGTVYFSPATYTGGTTIPAIPPNTTGVIKLVADPGASFALNLTQRRLFDIARSADGDTFKIWIEGFRVNYSAVLSAASTSDIDASRLRNHILCGTYVDGALTGTHNTRINYDRIVIRDCEITGAPEVTRTTNNGGSTALPAATITVVSTANFLTAGSFTVLNSAGAEQTITYTGKTATTFTGCTGGTGTMAAGATITDAAVSVGIHGALFAILQPAASSETLNYCRNVTVERFRMDGGVDLLSIAGYYTTTVGNSNQVLEAVTIRDCYHTLATAPSTAFTCQSFVLGGRAMWVKNLLIERCYGTNSGDVFIEIDNVDTHATIRDCEAVDSRRAAYYFANFKAPQNIDASNITIESCTARVLNSVASTSLTHGHGLNIFGQSSNALGSFTIRDFTYLCTTADQNDGKRAINVDSSADVRSLTIDGASIAFTGWTHDGTSATFFNPRAINIQGVTTGTRKFVAKNIKIVVNGTRSGTGGAVMHWYGIIMSGAWRIAIEDITWDFAVTSASATTNSGIVYLGSAASSSIQGTIRRLYCKSVTGDSGPQALLNVQSTTNLTIPKLLLVEECDFSNSPGGTDILIDATQAGKVALRGNVYKNVPSITGGTITPGASPYSYQNTTALPQLVVVSAGTVSAIDMSTDNSTFRTTGVTAGSFIVPTGVYLRVTYTVAPTMTQTAVFQ